jgi:copper(I)-binding protein
VTEETTSGCPAPRAHRSPARRAKLAVAIAVLAAASLVLSGCATGQRAQTAVESPVIDGVGANVGSINLRAVTIATPGNGSYPKGGTAAVQLYIVNNGPADQLVSVSSSAAKSAALFTSAAAEFSIPPTTAAPTPTVVTPTPTPTVVTSTSASSSSKSSKSATSSSSSSAAVVTSSSTSEAPTTSAAPTTTASAPPVMIPVASGETTVIGVSPANAQIMLSGLDTALYPAMSIPITFTFANAGSVTVLVSVHLTTGAVNAPTLATSHDTDDE